MWPSPQDGGGMGKGKGASNTQSLLAEGHEDDIILRSPSEGTNHPVIVQPKRPPINALAWALSLGMLASMITERISIKVMVDSMPQHRFVLLEFAAVASAFGFWIAASYKALCTTQLTSEIKDFPKRYMLVVAVLESLQFFIGGVTSARVPAPVLVWLVQLCTPFTLLLTLWKADYRKAYHWRHHVGAVGMIAGAALALLPFGLAFSDPPLHVLYNCLVFVASILPGAASIVFKENYVTLQPTSLALFNALTLTFQSLCGFVMSPILIGLQHMSDSSVWTHLGWPDVQNAFSQGSMCLAQMGSALPDEYCTQALAAFGVFVGSGLATIWFTVMVIERAGVIACGIAATLSLPLSYIGLELYNNTAVSAHWVLSWPKYSWCCIAAAALVTISTVLYHSMQEPGTEVDTPMPDNPGSEHRASARPPGDAGDDDDDMA